MLLYKNYALFSGSQCTIIKLLLDEIFMSQHIEAYIIWDHEALCHDMSCVTAIVASLYSTCTYTN